MPGRAADAGLGASRDPWPRAGGLARSFPVSVAARFGREWRKGQRMRDGSGCRGSAPASGLVAPHPRSSAASAASIRVADAGKGSGCGAGRVSRPVASARWVRAVVSGIRREWRKEQRMPGSGGMTPITGFGHRARCASALVAPHPRSFPATAASIEVADDATSRERGSGGPSRAPTLRREGRADAAMGGRDAASQRAERSAPHSPIYR